MTAAKLTNRAVLGEVPRSEHPKRHILLIKVYERRMVSGELWYYVKAIRFETLNPGDHLWGWIAAAELRSLGVFAD